MLDHVSLGVTDLSRSAVFYDAALGALGVVRVWTKGNAIGYGWPGGEDRLALFVTAVSYTHLTLPTTERV